MLTIRVHREGEGVSTLSDPGGLSKVLEDPQAWVWVDLEKRSPEADALMAEVFGFHPLAIEDVYKERHRPKIEDYDDYLYIIVREARERPSLRDVGTIELDLFLGKRFVVTHHQGAVTSVTTIRQLIRGGDTSAMEKGPVRLAHAILDRLVDGFLPLADAYEERIDRLESRVLKGEDCLAEVVELKGGLQRLRRLAVAQAGIIGRLARAEFDEIPNETRPFFRDIHEHAVQFSERIDDQREELNSVFDAYHSLSAHRMNEIMKVLTLISTVMLPLTFLAGVYGMNFDHMPELHWEFGYYGLWTVMGFISLVLTLYFRRRGWL